ncbi:aldo-keto reductase family protein, putative [Talaromyces stipitatus ATCC 10500]|uniref:Aldo-keto reductase family protein, putative n=1 Tax=Talaromyces stipitatus (strain ATCC 10500 / CBS 375.48 / QM 6759 / NRRL 1006) TaxID=441959 RepID=B8M552_TALSN|nr:aldo-keto reductase family protein, putative [Talaromyces stipitatus ATCC 10500]EED19658.1 aldo-keto reductase family protein, putative [Talaromyces stipitatus ATCC 10500]
MAKTVGVTNYDKDEMIKLVEELEKLGVPLATNQGDCRRQKRMSVVAVQLNFCICKGAVPVVGVGVSDDEQVRQNLQAEMMVIDDVSVEGTTTALWQRG